MNKSRKLRLALPVLLLAIGLSAPTVSSADSKQFSCSSHTCVKANLGDLAIRCFANSANRPQCTATARVGAVGKLADGFFQGGHVRYVVLALGGPVPQYPRTGLPLFLPLTDTYQKSRSWAGAGPETISDTVRAPDAQGPVNGCLQYQASFSVEAMAGGILIARTLLGTISVVAWPGSFSSHSHTVRAEKSFCVPR